MRSKKFLAALAALCLCGAVSCGSADSSSQSAYTKTPVITAATVADTTTSAQSATTAEEGKAAIQEKVMAAKTSNEPLTYGELGEKITPGDGDEE